MLLRSPRTLAKDVPLSGNHYEPTRNCLERDDNIDRDELRLRALRWCRVVGQIQQTARVLFGKVRHPRPSR